MTERYQEGKRQIQSGVQAIFTTDQVRNGNGLAAVGLLTVGGGVTIWIWAFRDLIASNGANFSQGVASWALTLASLGILIVLAGTGLASYSLAVHGTNVGRNPKGVSPRSKNPDIGLTNEWSNRDGPETHHWGSALNPESAQQGSRTLVAAVVQSLVYVACYGGLVVEYNDNPRMQVWVQNNLPIIGNLLNYYGVLLLSGMLGVFVVQFFFRKQSFS